MTDSKVTCWRFAIVFLAAVFISCSAVAQDHAPLPEQCIADARLWYDANTNTMSKLPYHELEKRAREMLNCLKSGAPDRELTAIVWADYMDAIHVREVAYLARHGLIE